MYPIPHSLEKRNQQALWHSGVPRRAGGFLQKILKELNPTQAPREGCLAGNRSETKRTKEVSNK